MVMDRTTSLQNRAEVRKRGRRYLTSSPVVAAKENSPSEAEPVALFARFFLCDLSRGARCEAHRRNCGTSQKSKVKPALSAPSTRSEHSPLTVAPFQKDSAYGLATKDGNQPKNESESHAQQDAGNDGKIEAGVPALINDVTRQPAQTKWQFSAYKQYRPRRCQHQAENQKQLADLANRVHRLGQF